MRRDDFPKGRQTTMQLTEEQHQLVEAAKGQPVDVVDPQSNRAYVLLQAELFQRVRPILQEEGVPRCALPEEAARGEPMRIKLRELPMPLEVAEETRRYCKKLGLWRRRSVQLAEDEAKLQYYFGGQAVVTLRSKEGPIIVAAGRVESETFGRQLDALPAAERRQVSYSFPSVWNDPSTPPRILFTHEDSTSPGEA
jgi:hypothetical protein